MQSFLKLCITILSFSLVSLAVVAQVPSFIYNICDNATAFTAKSPYKSNLNTLLSSLNSTKSGFSNGFYNATAGTGNSKLYGLFLCRGDLNSSTCRNCVTFASTDVIKRCPVEKEAFIWYDECMLRYSNESFFSQMSTSPAVYLLNPNSVSQPDSFNAVLNETMNKTKTEAANSLRRFATEKKNVTVNQSVYSLGQCTQDISESDCVTCLQKAISYLPTCCDGKEGGRVLNPSCNVRFEIYPFYNENATTPRSHPPTVAPSPSTSIYPPSSPPAALTSPPPALPPTVASPSTSIYPPSSPPAALTSPPPALPPTVASPSTSISPPSPPPAALPSPPPPVLPSPPPAVKGRGSQVATVTILAIVVPITIFVKNVIFH